jgi:hypothetical protein
MSTSITVEFQVNDLDANYEVLGTSDNYSFQEKLGLGSNLVSSKGEEFVKVIPLKGNYGVFDIRVFAVTDIGVRSSSLIGSVEVLPKQLENTFTFSEIKITDNRYENLESNITYAPQYPGDKLEVESEFAERSIKFDWNLIPPSGHLFEGIAVSNQLLNDTFFSGFKINIKNNGQYIDLSEAGFSSTSLDALANTFETDKGNVVDILQNYRDFYLNFDENIFNDLGLSRNVELEVISVDRFGREATGVIRASNPEPTVSNLTYSLRGSEVNFSWTSRDVDFNSVDINVLAVPEGVVLPFDQDLELSAKYFQSLKQAKPYNKYKGAYYNDGEKVVYDNKIYNCISGHTRQSNEIPVSSDNWELIGDAVDFNYFSSTENQNKNLIEDVSLSDAVDTENTFNVSQLWGYEYYYTFQSSDGFGQGEVYNFTNRGLVRKGDEDDTLDPLVVNIKLDNLRFREVKDDLVFNWDVTDQDGNLVDISQYKFLFGNNDAPSLLGISGSLYDVHTRQKITGITDGYNSKGLDFDEDGDLVVNTNLPSTKVFDQYKYTRESNNAIYGTGGFPVDYQDYNYQTVYNIGDNVLSNNKIYTSNATGNSYAPTYSTWRESETYFAATSDKFVYKNNVYVTKDNFGADADTTSGLYNEGESYNIGDIVLSPEKNITVFSEQRAYNPGDFVFHSGSIYECLIGISVEEIALIQNKDYWRRSDIFGDIKCSYFKSLSNDNISYPFSSTLNWEKVNPESLAANGQFFDVFAPAYEFSISNWSSGNKYTSGSFVVYANDIWSGTQPSQGQVPSGTSEYWVNNLSGQDFGTGYQAGDLVYSNNFIYQCTQDNPIGGPIVARTNEGYNILSTYQDTNWSPFWELNDKYDDIIFGHIGIPQSGKRSVGIELGIVDKYGKVVSKVNLDADNPAPYILREGFDVDSLSEATKVKFNFNYALAFQEKTTKVNLYRSSDPVFDVVDDNGFPLTGENTTFVKTVIGAGDATFGQNITQIIDEPPIPQIDGVDQITGYYYKILPFDDFGSGVLYEATNNAGILEKVLVYPSRYNNPNPDVMPGRVLRADPTAAQGAVPGPILDFSGDTSFENYFLNWRAPGSEYEAGSTKLLKQKQNDIDHYEIWASDQETLYTGNSQGDSGPWSQIENTGYRRIEGVMYSVGEIPTEFPDPALLISGAENIFNIPANSPSIETVYPGQTNDTKYFWVRAVDFAGNKSPFTGAALSQGDDILGLSLTLGQATATDIADFEINMTEKFGNSIALVPNNPFSSNSPSAGNVSWIDHVLYYQGTGYFIDAGNTNSGYVWWDVDELPNQGNYEYGNLNNIHYSGSYKLSDAHPQGGYDSNNNYVSENSDFEDTDFIIVRNSDGIASPVYYAFPNALIGTANIANAAISDAKINDLTADKITAGFIRGKDIQISQGLNGEAGAIRTAGFTGANNNPNETGFFLSGDGTFSFQAGNSSLSFEDDQLTLRGKLRQTNGRDYDFIDINLVPNYFNYIEGSNGFELESNAQVEVEAIFRNSSIGQSSEIKFKMDTIVDGQVYNVFDYGDIQQNQTISGFHYNGFELREDGSVVAKATLNGGFLPTEDGFHDIITNPQAGSTGDAVILYASGDNSIYEKSATISRVVDGRIGVDGLTGASVNIIFKRSATKPTQPSSSAGVPSGWSDSDPGGTGLLWASNGVTPVGGGNYTWGDVFQVEGQAVAEVYIYRKNSNSGNTGGSYNFTTNSLTTPTNWSENPPSLTANGDTVYVSVGLATGSATDTTATISWGTPVVFSKRVDGQDGSIGVDGAIGASPTYRGVYDATKSYYFISGTSTEPGRGDVVKYGSNYYICKKSHGPLVTGETTAQLPTNTSYWISFGAQFESVATDILLAQDAYITERLVIGDLGDSGSIISNGFSGGFNADGDIQTDDYDPAGFRLDKVNDTTAVFDVGGIGTNGPSYMRFSSKTQKFEIRGGFTNNSVESDIDVNSLTSNDPQAIFIGGGYDNEILETSTAGTFNSLGSSIVGGADNEIKARFSCIGNGFGNLCHDNFSFIGAGYNNSMDKFDADNQGANFIGAGQNNNIHGGTNQSILGGSDNQIIN